MQHRRIGYRRPAALAAVLAAGIATGPAVSAPAATADGSVTVRVVRAVDESGTYSPALEPGLAGVTVTLTGEDGGVLTAVTAADGTVTLKPAKSTASGRYRVDVINPQPGLLYPAFAAREGLTGAPDKLSSNTEFVDLSGGKQATLTTGLWNPADYCQQNAPLATACQPATTEPADRHTLVSLPYRTRKGADPAKDVTVLATGVQTGTVFGLAWDRDGQRLFSSAQAKAGTAYGPGGPGAIYVTDPATKATKRWATVPNTGATAHAGDDAGFLAAPGKESLGGLKLTEDGRDLYVVNLNDRKLYRYDATAATAEKPKAVYTVPTPDCPSADDWRPFGLGMQDGVGYLGGVCSGQSTQQVGDLRAIVLPFDPASGEFGAAVLDQPLDYPREPSFFRATDPLCRGAGWYPWTDAWPAGEGGNPCGGSGFGKPEPVLGEIGFETDGSMLLAFRDRAADRVSGANLSAPVWANGDLDKACKSGDTYVMDVNNGCGLGPRGTKFFDSHRVTINGTTFHPNAAYAGLALSKVETSIATAGVDPDDSLYAYGPLFTLRDGTVDPGQGVRLNSGDRAAFGKGASMGDLEVLCDKAPLQIGNRVWYDPERSGRQLPQQKAAAGVTVDLYDADGRKVGTAKTTDRGEYYFDNTNVTGGLKPNTAYTVRLDNPADYAKGGPLYHWQPAEADAHGQFAERALTTGGAGQNDHGFDFGFTPQQGVLRLVKNDQDGKPLPGAVFQLWRETDRTDGLQPDGDTKVGEPCTTAADGSCTATVDKGMYYWQEVTPPHGYQAPEQAVLGPVVLDDENLEDGVTTTAVNRLLPEPPTTPAATPPPTPGADPASTPSRSGSQSGSQPSGRLAFTGMDDTAVTCTLVGGAALLVAGAGVLIAVRRRRA
ncbi:SdrD B-like domain-containing protein [Kitasatospora sp. NPDC092948]|uniref:SdrD B-like domain-containing protein n=1 Tax=Kitasatospora sp. NPDC092948 TaxID=3364088 RepID=UPI00380C4240